MLDRWLDAMAAEGLDPDWYVTRHRTDDEILPWDHIAAGLHRDFLWDDWQAALRRARPPRLSLDPVLRLRGVHRLRARARRGVGGAAGRWQPGHRAGPQLRSGPARRCRSSWSPDEGADEGDPGSPCASASPSAARCGSSRHRDVARAFERAFRIEELPARVHRGVLAPPEGQLRAGALGRARERRRVPRRRAHRARRHRRRSPSALTPALPEGMPATGAVRLIERAPALQESITEVQYRVATVDGRRPARAGRTCSTPRRRARWRSDELRGHPDPQGQGERGRSPSRAPCHRGRARRRRAGARPHLVDATPWCPAA